MNVILPLRASVELHLVGGFSLDGILSPDGSYVIERPGGNALWAAQGVHLAGSVAQMHAVIGSDFPESVLQSLAELGFGVDGVRRDRDVPGVRVTFSYRADGSRSQPADPRALQELPTEVQHRFVDTTRDPVAILKSHATLSELPLSDGGAWHLGLLPFERFAELVSGIRPRARWLQADCPARFELRRDGHQVLAEHLPMLDLFLPSTSDTDVFLPGRSPQEIVRLMHELGAEHVVLKCAEDGALVSQRGAAIRHVPSFIETEPVDPTGAGDVFAGALAAEIMRSGDLVVAVCTASAIASFAVMRDRPLDLHDVPPFRDAAGHVHDGEIARRRARIEKEMVTL